MSHSLLTGPFAEQDFYLEEFRAKSLLIVLRAKDLQAQVNVDSLASVCQHLVANESRMIFLIETTRPSEKNAEKNADQNAEQSAPQKENMDQIQMLSARIAQLAKIPAFDPVLLSIEAEENVLSNVLEDVFFGRAVACPPHQPSVYWCEAN